MGFPEQAKNAAVKTFQLATQQKDILSNYRGYSVFGQYLIPLKEWQKAADSVQPFIQIVEESGEWIILMFSKLDYHSSLALLGSIENRVIAKQILQQFEAANILFARAFYLSIVAEAALYTSDYSEGLEYIGKAFALDERSDERIYHARLFQLQGDLLVQTNQPIEAEKAYHQAIATAQEQSAKWFELLAAKSLARLWQSQGKTTEAYAVLHGVYSWFTEGFDTKDMLEAKELLAELQQKK